VGRTVRGGKWKCVEIAAGAEEKVVEVKIILLEICNIASPTIVSNNQTSLKPGI